MTVEPLHLITEIEEKANQPITWLDRLLQWLDDRLPLLLWSHIPLGRRSTEHLLKKRESSALSRWRGTGLPTKFTTR
ncbi:unnamed protein product, partial [marine sediment metagenome]